MLKINKNIRRDSTLIFWALKFHDLQHLILQFKESFGDGSKPRNMDRLRRSLRSSIRKKKNKDNWTDLPQNSNNGAGSKMSSDGGKPHQWQSDEISVRSGTCNFHVKVRLK